MGDDATRAIRSAVGPLSLFIEIFSSPLVSIAYSTRRKIGVNRGLVKPPIVVPALRSAAVSGPEQNHLPSPIPARASFVRKAGRWTLGIVAVAIVLGLSVLWLYNRNFTSERPVVRASRFTSGNFVFPVQVAVFTDRVARYKPRFLGHTEDSITLRQIASVKVQSGPVFADVVIDTTGGSPPVLIHGLWKKDAEKLSGAIASAQSLSPMPVRPVPTPAAPASAAPN
jgi:hypothetical protein